MANLRMSFAPVVVRVALLGLSVACALPAGPAAAQAPSKAARANDQHGPWLEYARPEEAGFNLAKLDAARASADSLRSGAVIGVHKGRVFAASGAVDRGFMAHSVRKSLASALYGIAIAEKRLSMDSTLAELGIDDEPPLTEQEKKAQFRDLIAARSGVYHSAAYAASDQDETRPARESHLPGTFWFYNNWDFNTAETIYHRATGTSVFEAFAAKIAQPIGMEDFRASDGFLAYEPGLSKKPAHTFRISARDLARFGQLYLQEGAWAGRQIVPREWVTESLRPHSALGGGAGYGYLWWTYQPGALGERYPLLNRYFIAVARGTGGQALFVIPGLDMVVVHRGDTDHGRNVGGSQIWALVEQLASARDGVAVARPSLRPMQPLPLASQLPAPDVPTFVTLDATAVQRLVGEYDIVGQPGAAARVFTEGRRLFMSVPGRGEAELFALSPLAFTIKVVPGVTITFIDEANRIAGVRIVLGRETVDARRK
jgi:CubicO group peptidase (beta-lactamase class C family)